MDLDEFGLILDAIKGYSNYIYLHVKGEPLLHPKLSQFLDMAHEKGLKVNITTNGTLLAKNMDMLLSKEGLRQINISLHSLEQNQGFSDEKEYMDNIIDFIIAARDKELIVSLRLWNMGNEYEENLGKNKYIISRLFNEFNIELSNRETAGSLNTPLQRSFNLLYEFSKKQGIKIMDKLYLNKDFEFIWPDLSNEIYDEKGFCYGLRDQLGVLVDGTVIPCCLDGEGIINLGNIFNTSLKDILCSERAANIYNSFSNRRISEELCKRCGYRKRFN